MWWEEKTMRTFRCRLRQQPGVLGRFLSALGEAGGDIGEIRALHQGTTHVERDIVVFANGSAAMQKLVAAARTIAESAPKGEIVPSPLDLNLHRNVARAVARVALEKGLNRDDLTGYFD